MPCDPNPSVDLKPRNPDPKCCLGYTVFGSKILDVDFELSENFWNRFVRLCYNPSYDAANADLSIILMICSL